MGTCRFLLTNLAASGTVKNGTGGGAPARTETSPYVMERALNSDRRMPWQAGAPTTTGPDQWLFDVDLGSSLDVNAVAVHGLNCAGGAITGMGPLYYTSYPAAPVGIGGLAMNGRDAGLAFATFNSRYWTVLIEATGTPSAGRIVIGQLVDLGVAPNYEASDIPFGNRIEQVLQDGSVNLNTLGYEGRDFSLVFDPLTPAQQAILEQVRATPGTFTYFDPDGQCFEVYVKGQRMPRRVIGGGYRSQTLELGRCT